MSTRPIDTRGLSQCCIETIREYDGPEIVGKTAIACDYYAPTIKQARLNDAGHWEFFLDAAS